MITKNHQEAKHKKNYDNSCCIHPDLVLEYRGICSSSLPEEHSALTGLRLNKCNKQRLLFLGSGFRHKLYGTDNKQERP